MEERAWHGGGGGDAVKRLLLPTIRTLYVPTSTHHHTQCACMLPASFHLLPHLLPIQSNNILPLTRPLP